MDVGTVTASVLAHLSSGELEEAEGVLGSALTDERESSLVALLGDCRFLQARYEDAEGLYREALQSVPDSADWQAKAERSAANALSGAEDFMPRQELFLRLADPGSLSSSPHIGDPTGSGLNGGGTDGRTDVSDVGELLDRLAQAIGGGATDLAGGVLHKLSQVVGEGNIADRIWTNWYQRTTGLPVADEAIAIFKLAYMRETLFENNIVRTYPDDACTGFVEGQQTPPSWTLTNRTEDGSWNWLPVDEHGARVHGADARHDPLVGAAFTRFFRNVGDDRGLESTYGRADPGTDPVNVLTVSQRLFTREEIKEVPFLNLSAAAWIQFQNHDWVSHGENRYGDAPVEIDEVPMPEDHPARRRYHVDRMLVPRSWPDPTRRPEESTSPRAFLNEVTHWWDGSQIYGSDASTVRRLRSNPDGGPVGGGKLYLEPGGLLPVDPRTGMEDTGFTRNWWIGLALLHTLFVREHNAICDMLREHHPDMSDDALFLKARMVNAALMAKIHTIEWTPAILPNPALLKGMNANWYGLLTDLFDHSARPAALEAIRMRSVEIGGIIGNPTPSVAKYALSEEFVAVYRLHSLLPDVLHLQTAAPGASTGHTDVPLAATRLRAARALMAEHTPESWWASFGTQLPGQLVLHNYPATLQELSLPRLPFQDMGAIDLYRDRERGVPAYNQLRRELGLKPIESFDDLTDDTELVAQIRDVYGTGPQGDNVEDIDLLVGTLGESHRPAGFGFGETLFQVFILNASWRLIGDRFYTDDYRPEVYTAEGLAWVDQNDFKSVLLRHYPALSETGLSNVRNAFEPWDSGRLDPARHPLRQWEDGLADRWAGEAGA
jgi:hypothetical protein